MENFLHTGKVGDSALNLGCFMKKKVSEMRP